jgi:hypothetical protein
LTRWESVAQAALLTVGFCTTLGLVGLVLHEQGILREAYFWTITDHSIPHVFVTKGVLDAAAFVGMCLPLLIGAAKALSKNGRSLWRDQHAERTALLGLLEARRRPACRYVLTFALTGHVFGWSAQSISGIDTRPSIVPGAWTALEEDFAKDPPTYVVDVQFPAKNHHYPVRDFPILAGLLAERYRPVAWTSEGVIYQMNSSRGASEKSAGAENNRSD